MNIDEVRRNLVDLNWALDELPGHVNVLVAETDETFGVRIHIESGSGWFERGTTAYAMEKRTAQEGYDVIERSRVVGGVKVSEVERQ